MVTYGLKGIVMIAVPKGTILQSGQLYMVTVRSFWRCRNQGMLKALSIQECLMLHEGISTGMKRPSTPMWRQLMIAYSRMYGWMFIPPIVVILQALWKALQTLPFDL